MTDINNSNNIDGENLRHFCPTCKKLMSEIDLGGEVSYLCSCGECLEPNFINTIVENDSFEECIRKLFTVETELAKLQYRKFQLLNDLGRYDCVKDSDDEQFDI